MLFLTPLCRFAVVVFVYLICALCALHERCFPHRGESPFELNCAVEPGERVFAGDLLDLNEMFELSEMISALTLRCHEGGGRWQGPCCLVLAVLPRGRAVGLCELDETLYNVL